MMKVLFCGVFFLLGALLSTFAQTKDSPFNNYNDFIDVKFYESTPYIAIKDVDSSFTNAPKVNEQSFFWDFLTTNYIARLDYDSLAKEMDTVIVQQKVMYHIQQDDTFIALVDNYQAKVIDHSQAKDTVTINDILNVAVKFFNLTGITEEGAYSAKICVGIHALQQTEKTRTPYLEAFAFDAIINNLASETYPFYTYFRESIYKVYKLNLGVDKQEQLLRAQGAIFVQMLQSPELKQLLQDEYERKKEILPFILRTTS